MADLFDRLGLLATGDALLARPRQRSRFEEAAAAVTDDHFRIELDERESPRPAVLGTRRPTPTDATAGAVTAGPRRSEGTRVGNDLPARGDATVAGSFTPAVAAPTPAAALIAPSVPEEPVAAVGSSVGQERPTPTSAVEEHLHVHAHELYEHVHSTVHEEEHTHLSTFTELFQWIEAGSPAEQAEPDASSPAPATREVVRESSDREASRAPTAVPAMPRDNVNDQGTTVTIGRVEVRTVRPEPPARPAPTPAAVPPLEFAGPTLEQFLGGRA